MYFSKITSLALLGLSTHTALAALNNLDQRQGCPGLNDYCDPRPGYIECCGTLTCRGTGGQGWKCQRPAAAEAREAATATRSTLEQRQCIVRGGTCDPRPADPGCCNNMACVVSARGYVCEP